MQVSKTPIVELTEGWTQEVGPFTLRGDGIPVSLIGLTVTLHLRPWNRAGLYTEVAGDIRVAELTDVLASGQVYYKPDADDISATVGDYAMKWMVVDGAGDKVFFPNAEPDLLRVYLP